MTRSYHLENIPARHADNPRTFLMPTAEELSRLKPGDVVRLFFIFGFSSTDGCRAERMWVVITAVHDGQYKGVLTNQPLYLKDIQQGDEVSFAKEHIATILITRQFDETKKAIITHRALEKRQVNWVLRDAPHNEQDSGWQLFYGNEDDAYLDDAGNAAIITLEEVLEFEPLLEEVFASSSDAFDWSDTANRFVPNTTFHDFNAIMEQARNEQDEINKQQ